MSTINDKVIGNHIRNARQQFKLTQADCAARLDISTSYFARLERGESRINLERLYDLSLMFNVEMQDLVAHCCPEVEQIEMKADTNYVRQRIQYLVDSASQPTLEMMQIVCEAIHQKMETE